jgi:hypothetical protein
MIYVQRPAGGNWWLEWETVVLRGFAVASVLMVAYQMAYYANATAQNERRECSNPLTGTFVPRTAPSWADADFFWLSRQIDDLFR